MGWICLFCGQLGWASHPDIQIGNDHSGIAIVSSGQSCKKQFVVSPTILGDIQGYSGDDLPVNPSWCSTRSGGVVARSSSLIASLLLTPPIRLSSSKRGNRVSTKLIKRF